MSSGRAGAGSSPSGALAHARLGWAVSRHLVLGGQWAGWFRSEEDPGSLARWNLGAMALVRAGGRFAPQASLGVGYTRFDEEPLILDGPRTLVERDGIGLSASAGVDIPLTGRLRLVPEVQLLVHRHADRVGTTTLVSRGLTLGLAWH